MWKIVALAALLAGALPSVAAPAMMPTTAGAGAYGVGQADVRLFQDSVMPGTCGIVLERARCNEDFRAVQQWRGADPTDASFAKWLVDGDLSSFRGTIAQLPAWPGMSDGFHSDLKVLQNIPYAVHGGSWQAINEAASRATLDLTAGN